MNPPKSCLVCGCDFIPDRAKSRYCSLRCSAQSRKLTEVRLCLHCNQPFEVRKAAPQVHCSMKCAAARRHITQSDPSKKGFYRCEECGKRFEQYKFRKPRFCSRRCQTKYHEPVRLAAIRRKPRIRRAYLGYGRNWEAQRRKALVRDGSKCQLCGRQKTRDRKIDVHHITPFKTYRGDYVAANQLSNLITLCRQCHIQVERYNAPCPQSLL